MDRLKTFNPSSGELLAELNITRFPEIQAMVIRSKKAQIAWARKSGRERANLVINAYKKYEGCSQILADLIHNEMGKIPSEARMEVDSHVSSISRKLSAKEVITLRDEAFNKYHNHKPFLQLIEKKFGKKAAENIIETPKISVLLGILFIISSVLIPRYCIPGIFSQGVILFISSPIASIQCTLIFTSFKTAAR